MIASRKIERLSESAKVLQAQLKPDSEAELDHMQCNIRNEEQVSSCCTGLGNKFSECKIVNIFLPISLNIYVLAAQIDHLRMPQGVNFYPISKSFFPQNLR